MLAYWIAYLLLVMLMLLTVNPAAVLRVLTRWMVWLEDEEDQEKQTEDEDVWKQ